MQICGAINSPIVSRLRSTWQLFEKSKQAKVRDSILQFLEARNSFVNIRDYMKNEVKFGIPWLGIFLSDLTFLEEGAIGMWQHYSSRTFNFARLRLLVATWEKLQFWQIQEIPDLGNEDQDVQFALSTPCSGHDLTEKELYNRSLQLEPRKNV